MILRRRLAALVVLTLAGLGGFVTAGAVAPGDPEVPAPVERAHRYYALGPSASYEFDNGGIGQVPPLVVEVPGPAARTAVVAASFQYRTRGEGPFVVGLRVGEVGGERVDVRPDEVHLAPAPDGATTTVRFLVPSLPGDQTYEAHLGANSVFPDRGVNRVTTRKVLLTVELTER